MNPSDIFRIAATVITGYSQIKQARADGVVTIKEMLETTLVLAERSGLDTQILMRTANAPMLEVLAKLVDAARVTATQGEYVTLSDVLHIALTVVAEAGMSETPVSKVH